MSEINTPTPEKQVLSREPLTIEVPHIDTLPQGPVDAVIVLGMGPVQPTLVGADGSRRVGIDFERMRHNAIAAVELAARGLVKPEGLIIATGKATAGGHEVIAKYRDGKADANETLKSLRELQEKATTDTDNIGRKLRRVPGSQEELDEVVSTSEASLMKHLIENARAKSSAQGVPQETSHVEVFEENKAGNTLRNFVYALNELDRRARKTNNAMFDGSIALITAESGHMVRSMEIARLFGVAEQVVPLTSEPVLRAYGYDGKMYKQSGLEFNESGVWNEQFLIRAQNQIPEFVLPELQDIADTDRLRSVLTSMQSFYGSDVFIKHKLSDYMTEEPDVIRQKLREIERIHPEKEEWQKADTATVLDLREQYSQLTTDWLAREAA